MHLTVIGINHSTANIEVREKLAISWEMLPDALTSFRFHLPNIEEYVIISTCNRTEIYFHSLEHSTNNVIAWFAQYAGIKPDGFRNSLYIYHGRRTAHHLFAVISGLDSMIIGETQIAGQVKRAFQAAQDLNTSGRVLNRLFEHGFSASKAVRTRTGIGQHQISIASAAVTLARRVFSDFPNHTVLMIGAGELIALATQHMVSSGIGHLIIANRTLERAHRLASRHSGFAITLDEIATHLADADIIIASTGHPKYLLHFNEFQQALLKRRHKPMLVFDLAVPRNIDPTIAQLSDIFLYTTDDLRQVIDRNQQLRHQESTVAATIISEQVEFFLGWIQAQESIEIVRQLHHRASYHQQASLARARQLIARGRDPEQVMNYLAHHLTKRLLHEPSARLRQAGTSGDSKILEAARILFNLPDNLEPDLEETQESLADEHLPRYKTK